MYKHISSQLFAGGNIMYRERGEGQLDDEADGGSEDGENISW